MDIAHRFSFSAADGFAANSIDGLEENITHYGVPRTRSARVHNILLQSDLKARAASVVLDVPASPSDTFRVCTAGRLDEMKLIDTVIAALSQFPANIPWQLWILGRGPAEQELRSQAARLRVADRVRFLGWRENPHAFVARSDVFVQPSRFEGYSNALVEAMAIGVPAITSFHSSDARLIVKEGAALGFEPGNVKGLFDALMEFRSNPGLAETMRAAAQRHIEPMALERVIPEYEKVVCAALAHARK
jgi:glycosyltransferase involved in cell wall biosynthesis